MCDQKSALRAKMRGIANLRADATAQAGQLVMQLRASTLWQSSAAICAFAALPGEPDPLNPWPANKRIALPRVSGSDLTFHWVAGPGELSPGRFGILEPAANASPAGNEFDLILVPGLAFDLHGGRLGRGKGFYDRFLAGASGLRAGVCFDDQIVADVPSEPHDQTMDFLITPSSIFQTTKFH